MGKEIATQVQEAQRVSGRIKPSSNMLGHVVIKLTKIKERILKATREKATNNIQGNFHKVISSFLSRNSAGQKGVA